MLRTTVFVLALLLVPLDASAQRSDAAPTPTEPVDRAKPPDRRLYVAMWTLHFRDFDRGVDNNWLLGMSWGRVYGATFINSFGKRAYSVGMQELVARWSPGPTSIRLGYRAGLVTGYNERLFPLAGKTPVLPFLQPLVTVGASRLGAELSWAWVVASMALSVPF